MISSSELPSSHSKLSAIFAPFRPLYRPHAVAILRMRLSGLCRYDRGMNSSQEAAPSTVRLFPDYADTVLWFNEPIDYDTAKLSGTLTRELSQWERSYYDGLNRDYEWKSAVLARRFGAEGERMAQRVADELGDRFEIELVVFVEDSPKRKFRGGDQLSTLELRQCSILWPLSLKNLKRK